jgi:hypothetical protein
LRAGVRTAALISHEPVVHGMASRQRTRNG